MSKLKGKDNGYMSMSGPVMEGAEQLGNVAGGNSLIGRHGAHDSILFHPVDRPDPALAGLSAQQMRDRFLFNPVDRHDPSIARLSPDEARRRFLRPLDSKM